MCWQKLMELLNDLSVLWLAAGAISSSLLEILNLGQLV